MAGTQVDYVKDEDLAVTIDSLLQMGAEIIRTTRLDSGNWEVEYRL